MVPVVTLLTYIIICDLSKWPLKKILVIFPRIVPSKMYTEARLAVKGNRRVSQEISHVQSAKFRDFF